MTAYIPVANVKLSLKQCQYASEVTLTTKRHFINHLFWLCYNTPFK